MKYKEKQKLWLKIVKELSKAGGWKFKGCFIFAPIKEFFYSATFYVSLKENAISGWIGYKPLSIDNVFWDIIDEQPNKKRPLSFREEAAFCVRKIIYFKYKIDIADALNPHSEIDKLLKQIDSKVIEKSTKIQTLMDFQLEMLQEEKTNSVGIVTALIEQAKFESALSKISEYKTNNFNSGFRFGDKDFYDLVKEYCDKNYC